jgi:cytoskeletal protein CcmA (bactofilin family)
MATGSRAWRRLVLNRNAADDSAESTPAALQTPETMIVSDRDVMRIGAGLQFEGNLIVQKSVEIDGEFRGTIQSDSTVVIGPNAGVHANIRARVVIVHGALVGNVIASRELQLLASGRLTGDVEALAFTIEKGALFNGRSVMIPPHLKLRDTPIALPTPDAAPF